jgi:hypothetical protein
VLTIAAAMDLAGFGLESIHNAHGRSGRVLGARLIGATTYVATLALLLPTIGALGAAFATVATSLVTRIHMAVSARRILLRASDRDRAADQTRPGHRNLDACGGGRD